MLLQPLLLCFSSIAVLLLPVAAGALPPADDPPEEILRTEIILDARSPIDGQPLSAAEYAELEARLQAEAPGRVPIEIRRVITLLRLRQAIRSIAPFLVR